ncbi:type 2 lanthipeptide synthetase LanM family protein [Bacillus solimangrovi]|uniref:Lantibiotic biosynthesis protein dehydration domain-containing protein n=1 Tax=Bacillus solimangrovi TaxID=1305675 RepID=A0A1E5LFF8_9BACI|nr:type 2 lanthipeptide synthetase LanM family protein [Bacillus solimangrovi]OEH92800.1 hypothetical protein BFG57_02045 [Bacillus solimangrovi]
MKIAESIDLDKEKLKAATFINERNATELTNTNSNALNEWLNHIKLPENYIENFLKEYNKTETELNIILEQSPNEVTINDKDTKWFKYLMELINNYSNSEKIAEHLYLKKELHNHPYLDFTYPFLNWMSSIVKVKSNPILDQKVVEDCILEATLKSVIKLSSKVLTLEINELRNENKLIGNTSEERYLYFCEKIQQREYMVDLLYRYPTMFRLIIEESIQQRNYVLNTIEHLINDYAEIKGKYNIEGKLMKINMDQGDSHRGKKTVVIFEFEKGLIVYKPKSLLVDQKLNHIINYINNKRIKYPLKNMEVIAKENYGWQPYVEYIGCDQKAEIEELYYKMGVYTCIFHTLLGTDFHAENVIVSKSDPFFIDLESLFQGFDTQDLMSETAHKKDLYVIKDSILRTSLFPAKLNKQSQIDISGITGEGDKSVDKGRFTFENNYTDEIKIVRKPYITEHKKNIPLLNNTRINPREYATFISEGFNDCYDIICENKEDFLGEKGILITFKDCCVRTIVRNTKDYNLLLTASTNPNYLSNAINRNRLFDRMWGILNGNDKLKDIIPAETKDLLNFDIPYFYSFINSTSIFDSLGNEYKQFHSDTILNRVEKKIIAMDEEDKNYQSSMIKNVLLPPIKKWDLKEFKRNYISTKHIKVKSKSDLLDAAINLAEDILEQSVTTKEYNDISWKNLTIGYDSQWILAPLDNSLYDGLLGNALFFASLYKITNQDKYLDTVEKILISVEMNRDIYERNYTISAFTGFAASAYCYYYLGILLKRQDLKEKGIQNLLRCSNLIESDNQFDIIAGCAGTIIVAINIYRNCSNDEVLSIALKCGEHLLNNVVENDDSTVGWKNTVSGENILTGMSHGNAGIAWSLYELYKETKTPSFHHYALKALEYERTLYSAVEKNWFDLRDRENRIKKGFPEPVHWCHGASGIGMARIKCYELFPDSKTEEEIYVALEKTLEEGFGGSDSLCHGSMGNLDLFLLASEAFQENSHYRKALEIASDTVELANNDQWYCGIPQKSVVSSFMIGLSGIGYQLLRVIDSVNVPSVLTLELPREE